MRQPVDVTVAEMREGLHSHRYDRGKNMKRAKRSDSGKDEKGKTSIGVLVILF